MKKKLQFFCNHKFGKEQKRLKKKGPYHKDLFFTFTHHKRKMRTSTKICMQLKKTQ